MKWTIALTLAASLMCVSRAAEKSAAASSQTAADEPQLAGTVVPLNDGSFMTLTMDGAALMLKFFDKLKQPVATDFDRASVRYQFPNRRGERRVLVRSDDGLSMTGGRALNGPYVFQAFITLLHGEDTEGELYVVNYP